MRRAADHTGYRAIPRRDGGQTRGSATRHNRISVGGFEVIFPSDTGEIQMVYSSLLTGFFPSFLRLVNDTFLFIPPLPFETSSPEVLRPSALLKTRIALSPCKPAQELRHVFFLRHLHPARIHMEFWPRFPKHHNTIWYLICQLVFKQLTLYCQPRTAPTRPEPVHPNSFNFPRPSESA